jgi:hypothetical protein
VPALGAVPALLEEEERDQDHGRADGLRPGDPLAEESDRGGHAEDGNRVEHHAGRGDGNPGDRVVVQQEAGRQGDPAGERRRPGAPMGRREASATLPGEQRERAHGGDAQLAGGHRERVHVIAKHAF